MIALSITDLKNFMNGFLRSETFDHFLVSEATITTNVTYQINGMLNKEFYSSEELEAMQLSDSIYVPFSLLKPTFFELIKGSHTPGYFKFVLLLSPENTANVLKHSSSGFTSTDIGGMFLNFKYQNHTLTCTTGISYQTFSMNHILDEEWDHMVWKFLSNHNISFDELS